MRRSLALGFLLILSLCGCVHRPPAFHRPALTEIQDEWRHARQATNAPPWSPVTDIEVVDAIYSNPDGSRTFGLYLSYMIFLNDGGTEIRERIVVFARHDEPERVVRQVLFHEFLHALYTRFSLSNLEFVRAHPDSEEWVCEHGACGDPTAYQGTAAAPGSP